MQFENFQHEPLYDALQIIMVSLRVISFFWHFYCSLVFYILGVFFNETMKLLFDLLLLYIQAILLDDYSQVSAMHLIGYTVCTISCAMHACTITVNYFVLFCVRY